MSDEKLIELIAKTWLANGGDGEGFGWVSLRIEDKIKNLESERRNK